MRKLSLHHSSSSKRLCCILHATVCSPACFYEVSLIVHSTGERRIRVITLALPTTTNLSEVYASADQVALATLFANKAVERALTHKLEDSRDYVFQKLVDILVSYKASMTSGGAGASAQLAISDNLKMLPVLVLGLLKNVSCHQTLMITTDTFVGRYPTKRPDSARYPRVLPRSIDVSAFPTPYPVHLSCFLFST